MSSRFPPVPYAAWFSRHAVTRGDAVAIATPAVTLSYAAFNRCLHVAAHRLSELGVERGQTVALCIANAALHSVLLAALNRMGCVSVSLLRPRPGQALSRDSAPVPVERIVVEMPCDADIAADALRADIGWLKAPQARIREWTEEGFRDPDEPVHLFTSSGTTGRPKAIESSTRQTQAWILRATFGAHGDGHVGKKLTQFGPTTAIGFHAVFKSFWSGGSVFAGWQQPDIPAVLERHRIERIEGSPIQYAAVVQALGRKRASNNALRWLFVAGSVTPRPLLKALGARFRASIWNDYGSTELGPVALGLLRPETPESTCGFLAPWIEAQAVDEEGRVLPQGSEGILRFRHDRMATRYLNDPVATEACFKDGWFYPGDIGSISEERALSVTGRSSEQINAGGLKVSPDWIENVVRAFEGVEDCAAFGTPDALGVEKISVALVVNREPDMAALRAHCARALGPRAPATFKIIPAIPRTDTGKVRRADLLKMLGEPSGSPSAALT